AAEVHRVALSLSWRPRPGGVTRGLLLPDGLMEGPGVRDDVVQGRAGRLPAKVAARLAARGDRRGGVARAARGQLDRDRMAGDLPGCVDDLLDAVAVAV